MKLRRLVIATRRDIGYFFEVNYLRLNAGKGFWTWFADIYGLGLLVFARTGIFILPGRKGLGGRGRWLLMAGLAIPVVYLTIAVWTRARVGVYPLPIPCRLPVPRGRRR